MDLCRASQSSREQVKTEMAEQAVKKKKKKGAIMVAKETIMRNAAHLKQRKKCIQWMRDQISSS